MGSSMLVTCLLEGYSVFNLGYNKYLVGCGYGHGDGYGTEDGNGSGHGDGRGYGNGDGYGRGLRFSNMDWTWNGSGSGSGWGLKRYKDIVKVETKIQTIYIVEEESKC
jgi:hypothetical protein